MYDIWEEKGIRFFILKENESLVSKAFWFYKQVAEQYNLTDEERIKLKNIKAHYERYGVYMWYSSKTQKLLNCYEMIKIDEEEISCINEKIKEIDYKIDFETKKENWTQKFNDLINGKVWVYSKEDYEKWNENYYKTVKIKNITKEQLELKRKEAISNAIKIDKLNYELTKTDDIGKKYQINTKIKALEEKINKIIDKLDDDIYHTYYIDRYKGLIELKDSIKEREKEIAELDYAYTKEVIYNITYNTIKNIMCINKTM